jgi:hypothetical protein
MSALVWTFAAEGLTSIKEALRDVAEEAGDANMVDDEIAQLEAVGGVFAEVLEAGTREAHDTAAYRSRTGRLDASVGIVSLDVEDDGVTADWGAEAEHASFVEAKGFSRFGEVADQIEATLNERLSAD